MFNTKFLEYIKSLFARLYFIKQLCSKFIFMSGHKRNKKERKPQLSRLDYEKLRRAAYEYVVVQGYDQNQVAEMLKVTPATVSAWANNGSEGRWIDLRKARMQCASTDTDNIRKLIRVMSEQRLQLEESILNAQKDKDLKEEIRLRNEASRLSDEMSKMNKTLITLDKTNYDLGTFIDVTDEIFNNLRQYDEALWEKTIEFQSYIIRRKTNELG